MNRKIERAKLPTPEREKRIRNIAGIVGIVAGSIAAALTGPVAIGFGIAAAIALKISADNATAIHVSDMTIDEVVKERNRLTKIKEIDGGLVSEDSDKLIELDKRYRDEYVSH